MRVLDKHQKKLQRYFHSPSTHFQNVSCSNLPFQWMFCLVSELLIVSYVISSLISTHSKWLPWRTHHFAIRLTVCTHPLPPWNMQIQMVTFPLEPSTRWCLNMTRCSLQVSISSRSCAGEAVRVSLWENKDNLLKNILLERGVEAGWAIYLGMFT